jgi:hypothetical protein
LEVRINAPYLVAGVDELEEQVGAAGGDRQVTDLVDDQRCWPGVEADALGEPAFVLGASENLDALIGSVPPSREIRRRKF